MMKKTICLSLTILFVFFVFRCDVDVPVDINLHEGWKFKEGDDLAWAQPSFDDSGWESINPYRPWEDQGHGLYDGFAWYRYRVVIPSSIKKNSILKDTLQIILGMIDDTDQTFLNGELIGVNGKSITYEEKAPDSFTHDPVAYSIYRNYKLPGNDPRIKWDEENVLAIRVHDHGGGGGFYSPVKKIKVLDFDDFLTIDIYRYSFERTEGNMMQKKVELGNSSKMLNIEGKFSVEVEDNKNDIELLNESYEIILAPGEKTSVSFSFKEDNKNRYVVEYEFEEKKTGKEIEYSQDLPYILTPKPPKTPRINGPRVYGCRPGNPFLYSIPVTGERPITYRVENLPGGVILDEQTGIITGVAPEAGEYLVTFIAENSIGSDSKEFKIISGDKLALTPPMGWNSWNCWGLSVDQEKVKEAADFMASSGLKDHGWTYINIDDGWEAPERTPGGELLTNEKFPDMKGLCDYVHEKGLKIGTYSSPGPLTCGGYLGSYQHECQDVQTWAEWGIDYIKYDWCSYRQIAKDNSLEELQKPYILMRECLDKANRDIVYSLCQYGMGDVWKWGAEVGGNLWRTTGDITDTWESMKNIGFEQHNKAKYAGPGHWNDPDMLVVGLVGWGPSLHVTRLTASEQYTHISLWCLLSAPLLLGNDLSRLDDFTISLLTNDEVLALNYDPLGKQAEKIYDNEGIQYWSKPLEDGSTAVGIFNLNDSDRDIIAAFSDLNLEGINVFRDLWRQENLGEFEGEFPTYVPTHGVILVKVSGK